MPVIGCEERCECWRADGSDGCLSVPSWLKWAEEEDKGDPPGVQQFREVAKYEEKLSQQELSGCEQTLELRGFLFF